ncbi:putative peptidyl-tRNA hydrolase [Roseibium sp. TrichSKD4]|uniref:hypothetical protein n=1 Tax=Roseibium sp. TrichSKD4 TaxID=744980 RepID=UPI0001E576DF|nr:hypothetical protein [Roseibium sp. TrichSKD4]EFO28816.1 putative peptidyl-tRNA hydrolase [Roseibium sp. TrichSKD4]
MAEPRNFEDEEAIFSEVFCDDGSSLSLFLSRIIDGYEGKTDYRDFTEDERDEILLNALRMFKLLENTKGIE